MKHDRVFFGLVSAWWILLCYCLFRMGQAHGAEEVCRSHGRCEAGKPKIVNGSCVCLVPAK
jgi:hypothetical protein